MCRPLSPPCLFLKDSRKLNLREIKSMFVIYRNLGVLGCLAAALSKWIFLAEDENGDGWRKVTICSWNQLNVSELSWQVAVGDLYSSLISHIQAPCKHFWWFFVLSSTRGTRFPSVGLYIHRHRVFMSKQEYQCSVEILLTADVIGHSEI